MHQLTETSIKQVILKEPDTYALLISTANER